MVLPQVNSECMQIFIDEMASRRAHDHVLRVLDGAGWHKGKDCRLTDHLRLLFLPPYSPELKPQEPLRDELRDMANAPDRVKSIAGWDRIINPVSIAN